MLEKALVQREVEVEVLDGDEVRGHLSKDLGFSRADRDTNVRRIGYLCRLLSSHGVVPIAAAVSPYRAVREEIRDMCGGRFVEVYLSYPHEVLVQRDVKALYRKVLASELRNFTGVSVPYEAPKNHELELSADGESPEESVANIIARLEKLGFLDD